MGQTIQACLQRAGEITHSDSARLDAELLLAHVLERDRTHLYTWPDKKLSADQLTRFNALLQARAAGHPVAHLLGVREFWGLELDTDDSTLIPRPDTETLVEVALALEIPANARVLDLGTGTGAIALALASEKPAWSFVAVDEAPQAIVLAERNRAKFGFDHVSVKRSHWFDQVDNTPFHLIVSNPPYIDEHDPHLMQGDVRFEPRSALVAGGHGLADLQHIIETARGFLCASGWLLLEHGYLQGEAVRSLFGQSGYQQVRTLQDFGGNDRVSVGQWLPSSACD